MLVPVEDERQVRRFRAGHTLPLSVAERQGEEGEGGRRTGAEVKSRSISPPLTLIFASPR